MGRPKSTGKKVDICFRLPLEMSKRLEAVAFDLASKTYPEIDPADVNKSALLRTILNNHVVQYAEDHNTNPDVLVAEFQVARVEVARANLDALMSQFPDDLDFSQTPTQK